MKNEKTTYTQGPWRIGDAGRTVFGAPNGDPSPETVARGLSRANARLIAAAPDLLEAAKAAEDIVAMLARDYGLEGLFSYDPQSTTGIVRRFLSGVRAAISRAEGAES